MKKFLFIAAIAAFMCSCGTTKKGATNFTPTYHQELQNSSAISKVASVKREMRPTEPCEECAWERDLAAVGTATSYSEKVARNEAIRDARYELGRMMQVAVEGAAEDYLRNVTKNKKSTAESISEEINNQFYSECVKNSKVVKTTVYDLSDGQIQVYACVEVFASFDVLEKAADIAKNTLSKDEELEVEFDKEKFKQGIKGQLQEYKASKYGNKQ